jgi:uncharacterized protein YkwD
MTKSKIIILVLIVLAVGAGIYFRDSLINYFNGFGQQFKNFQKTDIGTTLSEVGKEILSPPPLQIFRPEANVVLVASKVVSETNLQRAENGDLPALTVNAKLNAAAMAKAKDMFAKQYFEHVSPSGVGPGQLAQNYGYDYIVEGENLILGNFTSEKEVVQDWMNSPGHRANILNNRYTEIGVAVLKGTYKGSSVWIGVQEFGLPMASCNQPNDFLKSQIDANQKTLNDTSAQLDQLRSELNNTNPRSDGYRQLVDQYNQLANSYNSLAETTKTLVSQYNSQVSDFNLCVQGK